MQYLAKYFNQTNYKNQTLVSLSSDSVKDPLLRL